jgi:hypothetical protein
MVVVMMIMAVAIFPAVAVVIVRECIAVRNKQERAGCEHDAE